MKVQIGETTYELKYTFDSIANLESMTKTPFREVIASGEFDALRSLMWAGLSESIPGLTLKGASAINQQYLSEGNTLEEAFELVNKAMEESGFLLAQKKSPVKKPSK